MIQRTLKKISLSIFFSCQFYAHEVASETKDRQYENYFMSDQEKSLWSLIEKFQKKDLFQKEDIELLIDKHLEKDPSSNQYFTFWEARNITTKEGITINRIVLGACNDSASKNMITLEIRDFCIEKESIIKKFGDLEILSAPRGRSLDEQTTYKSIINGKRLVFGFSERNPKCLSSIGMKLEK